MKKEARTLVAGFVVTGFVAITMSMLYTGRSLDSLILVVMLTIVLGAAYFLWDDAMTESVDSIQELQGEEEDDGESGDEGEDDEGGDGESGDEGGGEQVSDGGRTVKAKIDEWDMTGPGGE